MSQNLLIVFIDTISIESANALKKTAKKQSF